jgi:hypothetical protein
VITRSESSDRSKGQHYFLLELCYSVRNAVVCTTGRSCMLSMLHCHAQCAALSTQRIATARSMCCCSPTSGCSHDRRGCTRCAVNSGLTRKCLVHSVSYQRCSASESCKCLTLGTGSVRLGGRAADLEHRGAAQQPGSAQPRSGACTAKRASDPAAPVLKARARCSATL